MTRNVRVTILCEDRQHETFIRRFLKSRSFRIRDLRVVKAPAGRGSGEKYVRKQFPTRLKALRAQGNEQVYLVVMLDGDNQGVSARKTSLVAACQEAEIAPPKASERVLICVPTWNIETWCAYLRGETVDEGRQDYKKYDRESDCSPQVKTLAEMCDSDELHQPSPPSLNEACADYQRVFG